MNKFIPFIFVAVISFIAAAQTPVRIMQSTGVGTRAFSLGNNYVTQSNDLSALFWNPAGLAFDPLRQFQFSLDGFHLIGISAFRNEETTDNLQRFRLKNAGFMTAFPTGRGVFSIAGAFQNPLLFDDLSVFSGKHVSAGFVDNVNNNFKTTGGLRYWTTGFGLQIVPQTAFGISASLVTGNESVEHTFDHLVNGTRAGDPLSFENSLEGNYVGYDVRAGLMYNVPGKISAGLRFVIPQIITFSEREAYIDKEGSSNDIYEGTLYSSYSGAAGVGVTLPFMTISTEARATLPFRWVFFNENILNNSQANYVKAGGGVGIEVPTVVTPLIIRLGYSIDELDLHQYAIRYDGDKHIDWDDDGIKVEKNRVLYSAGLGYGTGNVTLDLAYGYQSWAITTKNLLSQEYYFHNFNLSLSIRI